VTYGQKMTVIVCIFDFFPCGDNDTSVATFVATLVITLDTIELKGTSTKGRAVARQLNSFLIFKNKIQVWSHSGDPDLSLIVKLNLYFCAVIKIHP
jgi:hypothetical protein